MYVNRSLLPAPITSQQMKPVRRRRYFETMLRMAATVPLALVLATLSGVAARIDEVDIKVSQAQPWVYLGKFGFGTGEASTVRATQISRMIRRRQASWRWRPRAAPQLTPRAAAAACRAQVNGTVTGLALDSANKALVKGEPHMLLYCDVEWAEALDMPATTYEECEEKKGKARERLELPVGWRGAGAGAVQGAGYSEETGFEFKCVLHRLRRWQTANIFDVFLTKSSKPSARLPLADRLRATVASQDLPALPAVRVVRRVLRLRAAEDGPHSDQQGPGGGPCLDTHRAAEVSAGRRRPPAVRRVRPPGKKFIISNAKFIIRNSQIIISDTKFMIFDTKSGAVPAVFSRCDVLRRLLLHTATAPPGYDRSDTPCNRRAFYIKHEDSDDIK